MNIWELPKSVTVAGKEYAIRTDFRDILTILDALGDPDLDNSEKWTVLLDIFYVDFEHLPKQHYEEAAERAKEFIDMGLEGNEKVKRPAVMDWTQDAPLIIPAVNRVMGKEVRAIEYVHWWTFLSAYMEIGDCNYTQILNIRTKKQRGKKLEKWEQEYIRENHDIVTLKARYSEEEVEEQKQLEEFF